MPMAERDFRILRGDQLTASLLSLTKHERGQTFLLGLSTHLVVEFSFGKSWDDLAHPARTQRGDSQPVPFKLAFKDKVVYSRS